MNKAQKIKVLEQRLTELLGKKSYTNYKRPCTGKYRGSYDYGLTFEDGTIFFISLGRKDYLKELTESVEEYEYLLKNWSILEQRTREIVERDNRQAIILGLEPIEFISLKLQVDKGARNLFWTGFSYKHGCRTFWHTDTTFDYACRGVGLNSEKSVDVYFDKKITRPDEKLGRLDQLGQRRFSNILLGYLYE